MREVKAENKFDAVIFKFNIVNIEFPFSAAPTKFCLLESGINFSNASAVYSELHMETRTYIWSSLNDVDFYAKKC